MVTIFGRHNRVVKNFVTSLLLTLEQWLYPPSFSVFLSVHGDISLLRLNQISWLVGEVLQKIIIQQNETAFLMIDVTMRLRINRSDQHGRKLLLVIPFIGNLLSFLAYIINYYFFYELATPHLLWGSVVGLSGGYICLNLGLYGYLSDVTTSEDRTMRLSILVVFKRLPLGMFFYS